MTSVTDGEAAQASNLLEGDIIGGLSSEGRVNFVNKKSAKVHFEARDIISSLRTAL